MPGLESSNSVRVLPCLGHGIRFPALGELALLFVVAIFSCEQWRQFSSMSLSVVQDQRRQHVVKEAVVGGKEPAAEPLFTVASVLYIFAE